MRKIGSKCLPHKKLEIQHGVAKDLDVLLDQLKMPIAAVELRGSVRVIRGKQILSKRDG